MPRHFCVSILFIFPLQTQNIHLSIWAKGIESSIHLMHKSNPIKFQLSLDSRITQKMTPSKKWSDRIDRYIFVIENGMTVTMIMARFLFVICFHRNSLRQAMNSFYFGRWIQKFWMRWIELSLEYKHIRHFACRAFKTYKKNSDCFQCNAHSLHNVNFNAAKCCLTAGVSIFHIHILISIANIKQITMVLNHIITIQTFINISKTNHLY